MLILLLTLLFSPLLLECLHKRLVHGTRQFGILGCLISDCMIDKALDGGDKEVGGISRDVGAHGSYFSLLA